jgi:hypothetical protein
MTTEVRLLDLVDLCLIRYCLPIPNFPKEMRDLIKSYLPIQLNKLGKVIDAIHLYDGDLDPHYWERRQITISSIIQPRRFGTEGGAALADALKVNSTLTTINLDRNSIGDEGYAALADALKVNSTLTTINLFDNSIEA